MENTNYNDLLEDEQVKKNLGFKGDPVTYVAIINDHSGSMGDAIDPTVSPIVLKKTLAMSNYNEQIETLKQESKEGMETIVTVIEFDNEILCSYDNEPVNNLQPLTDYWTRGMTSLYDAIAYGISRINKQMGEDEREDKAALVIVETDGFENSSKDYSSHSGGCKRLKSLIEEMESAGNWTFTFLGAGLDEKFAQDLGMVAGNTQITRSGNMHDTVYAYAAQDIGLKTFMGDRKRGVKMSHSFYDIGGTAKPPEENDVSDNWSSGGNKDENK
jgi:hypothetical protein